MKQSYYWVVCGLGVRLWTNPKFWHFDLRRTYDDKIAIEFGPFTIYK